MSENNIFPSFLQKPKWSLRLSFVFSVIVAAALIINLWELLPQGIWFYLTCVCVIMPVFFNIHALLLPEENPPHAYFWLTTELILFVLLALVLFAMLMKVFFLEETNLWVVLWSVWFLAIPLGIWLPFQITAFIYCLNWASNWKQYPDTTAFDPRRGNRSIHRDDSFPEINDKEIKPLFPAKFDKIDHS